ncbi:hypothetical protein T06_7287 [Trichinella sp. T6]|nr:hypothetical protein T06_7287 [Trichinella sp. T6]
MANASAFFIKTGSFTGRFRAFASLNQSRNASLTSQQRSDHMRFFYGKKLYTVKRIHDFTTAHKNCKCKANFVSKSTITYPPGDQLPRCLLFVRDFFPLNGQFKRCVTMIVLSRQIIDFTIPDEANDHKPAVIFDYNQCEGAVGKLNKMIKEYSTW